MTKIIFRSNFFSCLVIEQPAATREMQEKTLPYVRLMLGETQQKERLRALPVLCPVPECSPSSPLQPCDFSQKPETPVGFSQIIAPTNNTAACS